MSKFKITGNIIKIEYNTNKINKIHIAITDNLIVEKINEIDRKNMKKINKIPYTDDVKNIKLCKPIYIIQDMIIKVIIPSSTYSAFMYELRKLCEQEEINDNILGRKISLHVTHNIFNFKDKENLIRGWSIKARKIL